MKIKLFVLLVVASFLSLGKPTGAQNLNALSASDRASIESVCSYPKLMQGPAAYHACLSKQLDELGTSQAPSLTALSASDRASIESVCSYSKLMQGPATYHSCLTKQLENLGTGRAPSLTALSASDRASIESVCSYSKLMEGPAAYHSCLNKQLVELGTSRAPSLLTLSASDRTNIESACSYPKLMEGPAAYHSCLNKQLGGWSKVNSSTALATQRQIPAASCGGLGCASTQSSVAIPGTTLPAVAPATATALCAENGSCYGDISSATGLPKTVAVHGYTRADGTYVRGYYRSHK